VIAFALVGGSWIFLAFVVVFFFAVVYGYYTVKGSGISKTPYRRDDGSPEAPSEIGHDITQDVRNWDRGVAGHHGHRRPPTRVELDDDALRAVLHNWRDGRGHGRLAKLNRSAMPARDSMAGSDVVVFWDYLVPDAPTLAAALSKLRESTPFCEAALHLPIADAHPLSYLAAIGVEAARGQDRFWAAHDRLLAHPPRDERGLDALADLVEDQDRFRADVESQVGRARVFEHIALAAISGVHAVPCVFIDGIRYDGEPSTDELRAAIDASRVNAVPPP
jgi:hypothetical protein